jgi:xylulokinase
MNPYWDTDARGAFAGLSPAHGRAHIFRSMLEGIAFEQLFAVGAVEKVVGTRVKEFAAIGGGTSSGLWCRIMADVTGKNICLPETAEASALGAAIAAAVAIKWYGSFAAAAGHMTRIRKTIVPDTEKHKLYLRLFATYRKIYPGLKSMF